MNKRFVIGALSLLAVGVLFGFWLRHSSSDYNINAYVTDADKLAATKKLGYAVPANTAVVAPIDLKRPLRVAIGSLGFIDEQQNLNAGNLVLTDLSGAKGIELVERQSLDRALQEIHLSLAGLTRARDAVRAGKLLRADWFLLGTETQINGTNSVVVRVVDAHTGILRDAGVVSNTRSVTELAHGIAAFVRSSRENAATAKTRVYVAIGGFQDLSVNDRLADFPSQLRGYLTAVYIGSGVTLLEREAVDTLLNEVHLDMAGLTESNSNASAPLQSAFWLVNGEYQSYETTNREVELKLNVQRIFGGLSHVALRGQPGEAIGRQVKQTIDSVMQKSSGLLIPSRVSEIQAQMNIGRNATPFDNTVFTAKAGFGFWEGYTSTDMHLPPNEASARKRNREEAMRAFKTVLLLDPGNHEVKMRLAECLRSPTIDQFDTARHLYREIIEDPAQDKWTAQARNALVHSFNDWWSGRIGDPAAKTRWFETALAQSTNSSIAAFYRQQVASAKDELIRTQPESEAIAETNLFKAIQNQQDIFEGKPGLPGIPNSSHSWMKQFVDFSAVIRTRRLNDCPKFSPKWKINSPNWRRFWPGGWSRFKPARIRQPSKNFEN